MFVSALLLTGGTLLLGGRITRRPAPSPLVKLMLKADPGATPSPAPLVAEDGWKLPELGSSLRAATAHWAAQGKTFVQAKRDLLWGELRSQQLQEFNPEQQAELQEAEQQLNRHFLVATTGTAIAVTGLVTHTALGPLSIPFTLYTCMPLVQVVYQGIVEERRLRGPVIDLVAVGASLVAHYYVLCAASCALMCAAEKIVYRTQDRSHQRMVTVFHQQRQLAWVVRGGAEVEMPLAELQVGDRVVVGAGGVIPVDGVITAGAATVDQHGLTGEAQPVEKGSGDRVLAATLVLAGRIQIEVEKRGDATIAAQIGTVMNEIVDYRERQELRCDETADRLVLPTLGAGALTLARLGRMSAATVISANFTETLRIAYPLGALSYLNLAAQQGILVKDGRALEVLSQVDTVIFDKTGTLTLDQPHVAALHPCGDLSEAQLLTYAAAAEFRQNHPIARAILEAAQHLQLALPTITEAAYSVGFGIKVRLLRAEGEHLSLIRVGSARFMAQEGIVLPPAMADLQRRCHEQGHSLVYVAVEEHLAGALELHTTIRPEVQTIVQQLRRRNLKLYIISGDQSQPTQHLAATLGIDGYFAEVLPADKASQVAALQKAGGKICFIGDGINDAIALKQADVSISLRGATTVATDIAQIIFMEQNLAQLDHLFELAHQLDANLKRSFAAMVVPSCLNLIGALFFRFSIRSAIVLFNTSLLAGVANSLSPLVLHKEAGSRKRALETTNQKSEVRSHPALVANQSGAIPAFPHFKPLHLSDRAEIEPFVRRFPPYSHIQPTSLLAYDIAPQEPTKCTQLAWLNGNLVIRALDFYTMRPYLSFLGDCQVVETVQQLLQYAQVEGLTPELLIVPEVSIQAVRKQLDERYEVSEDRACFDYILSTARLRQLASEVQQPKAKELHKFQRKYPAAAVRLLNLSQPTVQEQVWALFDLWADKRRKHADETAVETTALARLLHFAPQLALVTVGVYLEGRLVAFTINEVVHDGYYIGHFGKADPAYRGLGLYLECATAQIMTQRGCQFMNYEEDLGSPGLRAYKEALQPVDFLKKYTIAARA